MSLSNTMQRVVTSLWEDLDTPISLGCYLRAKNGEWASLVSMRVSPADYVDPVSFLKDVQAVDLLRKCAGLKTGIDTRKAASDKFFEAERACARTNSRFANFLEGCYPEEDGRVVEFLHSMKNDVADLLGRIPTQGFAYRFGPGASYDLSGPHVSVAEKMRTMSLTSGASPYLPHVASHPWVRLACREMGGNPRAPVKVRGNRLQFVPKDATTDRPICIEPSLNTYLQLGVGSHFKWLLLKWGIDLSKGQSYHREMARIGSFDGSLATIDLSSASDTISRKLVEFMLPKGWYELLNDWRSRATKFEGRWYYAEKFSSMGNGFTFELETIIFAACVRSIARARGVELVSRVNFGVYGDDIIVPVEIFDDVLGALRFLGFTPNSRKTFGSHSCFRESCGGDYFLGMDVRPTQLKELPCEPSDWISLANGIYRLATRLGSCDASQCEFTSRAWLRCLDAIPTHIRRLRGPQCLGDVTIHDCQSRWSFRTRGWVRYFRVWRPIGRSLPSYYWRWEDGLAALMHGYRNDRRGFSIPLRGVSGFRTGYIALS